MKTKHYEIIINEKGRLGITNKGVFGKWNELNVEEAQQLLQLTQTFLNLNMIVFPSSAPVRQSIPPKLQTPIYQEQAPLPPQQTITRSQTYSNDEQVVQQLQQEVENEQPSMDPNEAFMSFMNDLLKELGKMRSSNKEVVEHLKLMTEKVERTEQNRVQIVDPKHFPKKNVKNKNKRSLDDSENDDDAEEDDSI